VLETIPYYQHTAHVSNTLKQLGFTGYSIEQEATLLKALQEHADEKANEEVWHETVVLNDLLSEKQFEEA
jgi:exopolyphosphatase/pppGpp-phosphohydrolase